jgi:ribosomal protein S12 methylthiotransferase accessory factor
LSIHRLNSSLRSAPLDETLAKAKRLASRYGVVRVTDTTRLDLIGIPVFASIRPDGEPGSLCVHAGKGVHVEEARVGAFMEAIEFAAAEYRRRNVDVYGSTPREVAAQHAFRAYFVDLCPLLGLEVEPDRSITCVGAEDVATGELVSIPAELVFFPYNENPGQRVFGTSTNGLCSGNTVDEATIHGLCELVERDIQAFNFVRDTSYYVQPPTADHVVGVLMSRIVNAGLEVVLRHTTNTFGLPYFQAFVLEQSDDDPIAISHGTGCHLLRDIAAVRALTEAVQSRLSYIHGGRDDLIERARFFASQEPTAEVRETGRMRARVRSQQQSVAYAEIQDCSVVDESIEGTLRTLLDVLVRSGFKQALRVVLTPRDEPLQVVRVVVPGLESFEPSLKRVGPRLRDHVRVWR